MNRTLSILLCLYAALILTGCQTQYKDYSPFITHMPRSVLVLPPVNEAADVNASSAFLSTITRPLAESGYYVFPVVMVDQYMQRQGAPLPGDMHNIPIRKLGDVFGVDAVLYVVIHDWSVKYIVLNSVTEVTLSFQMVDVNSGETLWAVNEQTFTESSSQYSDGSLIGMVASATAYAITSAATDHEKDVARMANNQILCCPTNGLIKGPRHPQHEQDVQRIIARQEKQNSGS